MPIFIATPVAEDIAMRKMTTPNSTRVDASIGAPSAASLAAQTACSPARSGRSVGAVLLALTTLCAVGTSGVQAVAAPAASLKPGQDGAELIVMAEPGQISHVVSLMRASGAEIGRGLPIINGVAVRTHATAMARIESMDSVEAVVVDQLMTPMGLAVTAGPRSKESTKVTVARPTTAPPTTAPTTTAAPTTAAPNTGAAVTIPVDAPNAPSAEPVTTVTPTTVAHTSKRADESEASDEKDSDQSDKQDRGVSATGSRDSGSLEAIARTTGARSLWRRGITGKGVDVALIDTGIVGVTGAPDFVNGADLSADAANTNLKFLDGFGHGTHMAGIIAGQDPGANPLQQNGSFVGIAPDARIVNVKVGAMDGRVHSSQVVAAIDWVVQNRQANGMNIRVINLSYGSPATPDWRRDPLAWAAEVAWRKGIVVVAAAGNEGTGHQLSSPAYSPEILAVGATETEMTRGGKGDYTIAAYTSTGTRRRPDLFVPGGHVISLRAKGSFVDTFLATQNVGERFTRGSGTSQATAVTAGLAALLIEAQPSATPDQIKAMLLEGTDISGKKKDVTGIEASIDVLDSYKSAKKRLPQVRVTDPFATCGNTWCRGIGDGSPTFIDWAKAAWSGSSWSGSAWTGSAWTGSAWTGNAWTGSAWTGNAWTGSAWTGSSWSGSSWSQDMWSGSAWTGSAWTGSAWTGSAWTGSAWTGSAWTGSSWSGAWD